MRTLLLLATACSDPFGGGDPDPSKETREREEDTANPDTADPIDPDDTADSGDPLPVDADGDGYTEDVDCIDDNPTMHPGAEEIWYDGFDGDCLGDNDYDQDHDGYLAASIGGDDCIDTNPSVYPGALDAWYDGLDADCAGDDDYDADLDGDATPAGGGEDCDDADPDVSSAAIETLDDAVDGDCNGDPDGFRFQLLNTYSAVGAQGPRIASDGTYVLVSVLADTYADPSDGSTRDAGAFMHYFSGADLTLGSVGTLSWYWGSGTTFQTGFGFEATANYYSWAYGSETSSVRYLMVDVYDVSSGGFAATGWTYPTTRPFQDVELVEDVDDTLHVVGCDTAAGFLTWMHARPADFYAGNGVEGDDLSGVDSDVCGIDVMSDQLLVVDRSARTLGQYAYSDTSGIAYSSALDDYGVYDIDTQDDGSNTLRATAEGTDGVRISYNGQTSWVRSAVATTVRAQLSPAGHLGVVSTDEVSNATLAWGDPALGLTEVVLDHGLVETSDADLFLNADGVLLVAVRGGDRVVYGLVRTR